MDFATIVMPVSSSPKVGEVRADKVIEQRPSYSGALWAAAAHTFNNNHKPQ
jgi:hypothetical protein